LFTSSMVRFLNDGAKPSFFSFVILSGMFARTAEFLALARDLRSTSFEQRAESVRTVDAVHQLPVKELESR
jgi:hypothetical protein